MNYQLYKTPDGQNAAKTIGMEPQISFLFDPDNTSYQEYLAWVAEGNEPLPADEPTNP